MKIPPVISAAEKATFLNLVRQGYSGRMAAVQTSFTRRQWDGLIARDADFKAIYEEARKEGAKILQGKVFNTMQEGIEQGNPFFTRLAIANWNLGLEAPDVVEKRKLKDKDDTAPENVTISVSGVKNIDGEIVVDKSKVIKITDAKKDDEDGHEEENQVEAG